MVPFKTRVTSTAFTKQRCSKTDGNDGGKKKKKKKKKEKKKREKAATPTTNVFALRSKDI